MVEDLCKVILFGKTTKIIELCYMMNLIHCEHNNESSYPSDEDLMHTWKVGDGLYNICSKNNDGRPTLQRIPVYKERESNKICQPF